MDLKIDRVLKAARRIDFISHLHSFQTAVCGDHGHMYNSDDDFDILASRVQKTAKASKSKSTNFKVGSNLWP